MTATHTLLRAEGFTCPSCVTKIEKSLKTLPGVDAVKVSFATSKIEVDHDVDATSVDGLVAAIKKAGYTARPSAFRPQQVLGARSPGPRRANRRSSTRPEQQLTPTKFS